MMDISEIPDVSTGEAGVVSAAPDYFLVDETPPEQPRFDPAPFILEKRGTSSQKSQQEFWFKQTIHKNSVAAKLRTIGMNQEATVLEQCHTSYTFAVCKSCNGVSKFPNRCDRFYCPECQPRLQKDRERAVKWWAFAIKQPKHVVLTVKNIPDLAKGHVLEFRCWFNKLRRSKFAENWLGGFYRFEVTNEGRGWHLHLHALVDARFIDKFALSEMWAKITKGFGRIVEVKDARGWKYLNEVTKYAVKGAQLAAWSPGDIQKFINAFQGVKTFGVFGSLYGKRTEFAEYWKQVRDQTPICKCGCCEARYFSESEFLEKFEFQPTENSHTIPPPRFAHPEFAFTKNQKFIDAISR